MKKIFAFAAFAAALTMVSCNKETNELVNPVVEEPEVVTIKVNYEEPLDKPDTKISISESGSKFSLIFDGTESMKVGNTTNSTTTTFTTSDSGTTSANFTGTLPSVSGSKTNYLGIISTFGSVADAGIRGSVAANQSYDESSISSSCLLVGREDDCNVGTLPHMSLKTMNAFLKFSLIKGTKAEGSSHDYSTNMYVKDIIVESVNEEQIAGKFCISKTGSDWTEGYIEDAKIDASDKSSSIILDCTNGGANAGVDLTTTPTVFYIPIAFGTYAKGLKVTVNVQNAKGGDTGEMIAYISKNSSYVIARNTMVAMPDLTINPADTDSEIICWSENWTGAKTATAASDDAKPSACGSTGTVVYDSGSVTYTESSNSTYVRNENMGGGTAPELLLTKAGAWTISGIPSAGGAHLSLTYKSNNNKSSVTLTGNDKATISGSSKSYTITTGGDSTINLVFSASGNTRIDDIVLKVVD